MTCQELRTRADAYARGELDAKESAAFEAHLATCSACESALLATAGAPPGLAGLPRSIQPATDLWPAIRARVAQPRGASRRIAAPRWALAAAAVVLVAVSSGLTAMLLTSGGQPALVTHDIRALEAQYSAVSQDLSGALEQARSRLSPETMATIERNLRIIDAALDETRQALARDPANPALGQMVVAAWRQKVDLLRRATALGTET
jgi:putative zinc finger protein